MLKLEQVPYAAIEAAVAMRDRGGSMSDIIRTAINAWPGMHSLEHGVHSEMWLDGVLILPLTETSTKENDNG